MKVGRFLITGVFCLWFLQVHALGNTLAPAFMAAPIKPELQRLRWKGKTIRISISNSLTRANSNIKTDSDVIGAIRRSVLAWVNAADIDLQVEFSEKQNVSPSGPAGDGVSLITIAQTPENVLFFSRDAESVSAKTRVFFNRKGTITEADIVLNPFQQFSTDGTFGTFDLQSTLTHEIGHLLGLRHSGIMCTTMAASFARLGTMGLVDLSPQTLSASDVAAIRDLYGKPDEVDDCCSVISGKVMAGGKPGSNFYAWAEETASGRVVAEAEISADGTYRMGGLPGGEYSVYWKTKDSNALPATGVIGKVSLATGETKVLNDKMVFRLSDHSLQYIGINGVLADYGISLSRGGSYVINLGGRNIDPAGVKITFNTSRIRILQFPTTVHEFSEGVSGASFLISVDADAPVGQYSVFASGSDGSRTSLVGAINIE